MAKRSLMELAILAKYPFVLEQLGERRFRQYCNVLTSRAIHIYAEHQLDNGTIGEDLYQEDSGEYPNIDESARAERMWIQEVSETAIVNAR